MRVTNNTPAIDFVFKNDFDSFKNLSIDDIVEVDDKGRNAIHAACFKGYVNFLNYIIEKLGNNVKDYIDIKDNNGKSAVMYCCGMDWYSDGD